MRTARWITSGMVVATAGLTSNTMAAEGAVSEIGGALLSLIVSLIQLVVGLGIAAFAIDQGLKLVSKLLTKDGKAFDIWEQVKSKNTAAALLAAGVVLSYTNVLASGIRSMSNSLSGIVEGSMTLKAGLSALLGAGVNLAVAIAVASFAITVVFKIMDRLTKGMSERDEFLAGNTAIGVVYFGILIGVSGLVAAGVSGVGAGVTRLFSAIFGLFGL